MPLIYIPNFWLTKIAHMLEIVLYFVAFWVLVSPND